MLRKAMENIEAAKLLEGWKLFNAVANRAYYAAYQAGWCFLVSSGHPVPESDRGRYWPHDRILDDLADAGMAPYPEWEEDIDLLQNQRVKADYTPDALHEATVTRLVAQAERIVEWVKNHVEK
jgi:HEPN domain